MAFRTKSDGIFLQFGSKQKIYLMRPNVSIKLYGTAKHKLCKHYHEYTGLHNKNTFDTRSGMPTKMHT